MKAMLLTIALTAIVCLASGQERLPAFVIANTKGKYINSKDLVIKKQLLLVYFEPDCEQCRQLTALLSKNNALFQRYQVVMVTNADLPQLKRFVHDFGLGAKKDLVIGTEGWTRTLQRALAIRRFPYAALYDADLKVSRIFVEGEPEKIYKQLVLSINK